MLLPRTRARGVGQGSAKGVTGRTALPRMELPHGEGKPPPGVGEGEEEWLPTVSAHITGLVGTHNRDSPKMRKTI